MPLIRAIRAAGQRPPLSAERSVKKNYAERLSNEVALALAAQLRRMGLPECQPGVSGGKEKQFAGGIGAKKVDVSYATPEDGLILAISVKSISFPDPRTKNFQKNLTNRRGDLLAEATTLHQRFPYAVVGGLFLFDEGAEGDGTARREPTVITAHEYFGAFYPRGDRSDAVERFETLGIVLYRCIEPVSYRCFRAGKPKATVPLDELLVEALSRVAERNPDRFRLVDRRLVRRGRPAEEGED